MSCVTITGARQGCLKVTILFPQGDVTVYVCKLTSCLSSLGSSQGVSSLARGSSSRIYHLLARQKAINQRAMRARQEWLVRGTSAKICTHGSSNSSSRVKGIGTVSTGYQGACSSIKGMHGQWSLMSGACNQQLANPSPTSQLLASDCYCLLDVQS